MQTRDQLLGLVPGFSLMSIPETTILSLERLLNVKPKPDIVLASRHHYQYVFIIQT